jgi:aspartyl protease family protein
VLCLLAALGLLVAALAHAFPRTVRTPDDWAQVAYAAGLVVLIAAGVFRARAGLGPRQLRHLAGWALVVAALALGFAYRDELAGVPQHLQLAFSDGSPVRTADHELAIPQDPDGGFVVVGEVNGHRVRFVVDTGSTDTVLSPDDARAIGLDVDHLAYVHQAETANGVGYGAPVTVDRLAVGPIVFRGVKVVVNQAPMSSSLLGLSFLNRLDGYQVQDHKLILRWRDAPG